MSRQVAIRVANLGEQRGYLRRYFFDGEDFLAAVFFAGAAFFAVGFFAGVAFFVVVVFAALFFAAVFFAGDALFAGLFLVPEAFCAGLPLEPVVALVEDGVPNMPAAPCASISRGPSPSRSEFTDVHVFFNCSPRSSGASSRS